MTDATRAAPASSATAAASAADPRAERVAAAVKTWQRSLVDLGGRNSLLWYRDLPSGTLDLTTAHPGGVSMLMAGRPTKLSQLVREPAALVEARRRTRAIRGKALELREERGIAAGFIAIGMATWSVPRAARPPASPVLLRPCVLRPTGAAQEDFEIDLGAEVEFNPVLREYLRSEQGIEIDGDELAESAFVGTSFDPYPVFAMLDQVCSTVPDFTIAPRIILGTFSYAKLPMVADLAHQGDSLADHDVIAALAGDESALAAVRMRLPEPVADPDPEHEYLVLDADSSQQAAIDAVRAGAHLVVNGPPGTGKSQTIANLIAALAAEGKSTLFVAEKRAAIDAVLSRLHRLGLGNLVLDAYDGLTNKRAIAQSFRTGLDAALGHVARDSQPTTSALRDRRARLVQHVEALHRQREPWGVSAHDVQQAMAELASLPAPPTSHVRLPGQVAAGLTRARAVELGRRLRDAVGLGAWLTEGDDDPWFGARVLTHNDAAKALDLTTRLSTTGLEGVAERLNGIMAESHVAQANSISDWAAAFSTMARVRETLEVFRPEVFDMPLGEHIAATAPREWRHEHGVSMGLLARWRTRRAAQRLLRPGRPPAHLHDELVKASEQRTHWSELVGGGGRPEISPRVEEGVALLDRLSMDLTWLSERLATTAGGDALMDLPLVDLRGRLARLAERPDRLAVLPQVTGILDEARAAGLGDLVDELAHRGVTTEQVIPEVEHVWWASLQREITVRDPHYGAHDGAGLRRAVDEFVEADRAHLAATVDRVRAAVARNVREIVADAPALESLVRAEGGKARRHKPLRDLMPQAAAALTAIKPCWAMSPLVVAGALPPGKWFDVVIFDEASQVQPAQAISAISRARQVVVAGDDRQLPPTNFFTVAGDDDAASDESLTSGFESILDVLTAALPTRRLGWHYRSRDERLIAFSNQVIYDGSLTTFPGTSIGSAVTFEAVDGQAGVQPGADSIETTEAEVQRVVALVLQHARTRPEESLGVIALGIRHMQRLEEAITIALSDEPNLADFFADDRDERFFVKNLERVQGDERDAIILSVGYGKTPHGRVLYRFGPLNIEGGERRLNVAITRARTRMTVVSSLRASDLDPGRLNARGAIMLRDFLAYAEAGGAPVSGVSPGAGERPSADPLRSDLAMRLRREGLVVHEDFGSALHRIDLAVEDPYHRGRALVAIETDGPRYAALRSTRDRDRLRPEQLGRLGWKHMRVWSTDLFRDPAREIARILKVARDERVIPDAEAMQDQGGADATTDPAPETGPRARGEVPNDAPEAAAGARSRRKRRRVFRKGTAGETDYEEGSGPSGGDRASRGETGDTAERERWLQEQRPPHYE